MPKTIIKRRKFMKRKMFLIVISVLVLCLTCGMLFVACNDKNDNNDNNNDDHNTTTGSAFDTFKDVVFELEDVKLDTTGAKEFNFGLDVTAADDASKSLFSLAFETLGGEEYIYGSVNGGAMTKFNGFDLGGTVETVLSWFGDSISIMGIPVELNANGFLGGVAGELLSALIGDAKVSSDGSAYAIVLNLEGLVGLISGEDAFLNLDQIIADAGLGDIFGMIIPAIGGLITPDGSDDASPATVTELVEAIADNYTLTFYFGFEDNTGKDAAAEKAAQPFGDLALSSKVMAAREADAQNLLNFTVDGTVYGYEKVVTPATDEGGEDVVTVSETPNKKYKISIGADLNIFELVAPLLDCVTSGLDKNGNMMPNGFSMDDDQLATLMAAIENLGYINITIDEVNIEDDSLVKNLITIHSNFEEGMAIAAINLPDLDVAGLITANLQIGGVYDFDGIADVVKGLIANAAEEEPAAESSALDLGGIDIMGILKSVLACVDYSNMAQNGITIQVDTLVDTLIDTLLGADSDLAPTVADAVMGLMGSDVLNITATAGFGTCTEESKVVTDDLISWIGTYVQDEDGEAVTNEKGDYIVEVTSMDEGATFPEDGNAEDGVIKYPEGQMFGFANYNNYERRIPLVGKTVSGEDIHFFGYIVGTNMPGGLYPEAGTYENPIFYIGLSNGFDTTITALSAIGFSIEQSWPVSGIIAFQYQGTVEIVALSEDATTSNTLSYKSEYKVGETLLDGLTAINSKIFTLTITDTVNDMVWKKTMKNTGFAMFDAEGNDVTDTAFTYVEGMIPMLSKYTCAQAGSYTLVIYAGSLSFEYQFTVVEA